MADDAVFVDTNVLLTATTSGRALHREALEVLSEWPVRGIPLWVSGQVLREYLAVATRPADVNGLGLELEAALENVDQFRSRMKLADERAAVFRQLEQLIREVGCRGKQVHDANVVATALVHGVSRILTINVKDFRRFASYIDVLGLAAAQ